MKNSEKVDKSDDSNVVSFSDYSEMGALSVAMERAGIAGTEAPEPTVFVTSLVDASDVGDATRVAASSFTNFVATAEGEELFGYVLDGRLTDERAFEHQEVVDQVIGSLQVPPATNPDFPEFQPPEYVMVAVDTVSMPDDNALAPDDGFGALVILSDEEAALVLIPEDIGFRDLIMVAQQTYADVVVAYAEDLGVPIVEGDVAKRLTETLKLGDTVAPEQDGDRPEPVDIVFEGTRLSAIRR